MKSYITQTWLRFVNTYFLKRKSKEEKEKVYPFECRVPKNSKER